MLTVSGRPHKGKAKRIPLKSSRNTCCLLSTSAGGGRRGRWGRGGGGGGEKEIDNMRTNAISNQNPVAVLHCSAPNNNYISLLLGGSSDYSQQRKLEYG